MNFTVITILKLKEEGGGGGGDLLSSNQEQVSICMRKPDVRLG